MKLLIPVLGCTYFALFQATTPSCKPDLSFQNNILKLENSSGFYANDHQINCFDVSCQNITKQMIEPLMSKNHIDCGININFYKNCDPSNLSADQRDKFKCIDDKFKNIEHLFEVVSVILSFLSYQDIISVSQVSDLFSSHCNNYLNLTIPEALKIVDFRGSVLKRFIFLTDFSNIFTQAYPQLVLSNLKWDDVIGLLVIAFDVIRKKGIYNQFFYCRKELLLKYLCDSDVSTYYNNDITLEWYFKHRPDNYSFYYVQVLALNVYSNRLSGCSVKHLERLIFHESEHLSQEAFNFAVSQRKVISSYNFLENISKIPKFNLDFFIRLSPLDLDLDLDSTFCLYFVEGLSNALRFEKRDIFLGILTEISSDNFPKDFQNDLEVLKSVFVTKSFVIQENMTFDNPGVFYFVFAFCEDLEFVKMFFLHLHENFIHRILDQDFSQNRRNYIDDSYFYDSYSFQFDISITLFQDVVVYIHHFYCKMQIFQWDNLKMNDKIIHSFAKILESKWIKSVGNNLSHQDVIISNELKMKLIKMINLNEKISIKKCDIKTRLGLGELWYYLMPDVMELNLLDVAVFTFNLPAISFILDNFAVTEEAQVRFSLDILKSALNTQSSKEAEKRSFRNAELGTDNLLLALALIEGKIHPDSDSGSSLEFEAFNAFDKFAANSFGGFGMTLRDSE